MFFITVAHVVAMATLSFHRFVVAMATISFHRFIMEKSESRPIFLPLGILTKALQ